MKKSAGFTLIELVIVIVILGILGAVAAPRFINMQGDAYEANVKALNGSIQSAMTLANTKAILGGYDKNSDYTVTVSDFKTVGTKDAENTVNFTDGFPAASKGGIVAMLQDTDSFSSDDTSESTYVISVDSTNPLIIAPRARGISTTNKCQIEYTEADGDTPAKVKAFTEGC